ncbi:MAG TPA: methyltransferase domain-containing protein [Pyrinomonadaceae bacterium]|nr:methyltransferase domain-containing protein [Pyrinomonadaceae bacterium]
METKLGLVQRLEFIKSLCRDRSVLHLGCTNWPYTQDAIEAGTLLHKDLAEVASELTGFDFDQEGIDILSSRGFDKLFRADLEKLEDVGLNGTFDVIVAGEMIEHLNNPGLFLEGIKRFMHRETLLVITTINAYSGMRFFVYGLRGRGGDREPVHPDHVAYYSYSTLKLLLERFGFQLADFQFYDIGSEHRPHNGKLRNFVNDVCVKIAPQWADGVIAVCKLPVE